MPLIFRLWEDFLFLYLNIELVAIITQNWGPNNIFRGVNEKNTSEKNINEEITKRFVNLNRHLVIFYA